MRAILLLALCAATSPAALERIYVNERTDVLGGRPFGNAGPYERITGRAHFAVDPSLPANRIIVDLDKAARNAKGLVEFSADFHMLKPRDPAKGNGTALFEVLNRGNKVMLRHFNFGRISNDPQSEEELGDRFLLEQGYTLIWLGWQFDVPEQLGLMRLYAPRIPGLTGLVRAEFVPAERTDFMPLSERNHVPYPVADMNSGALTVRERHDGERRPIARTQWKYDGEGRIRVEGGLEPGRIYEFVYRAKDPAVVGLGPAAVRDLIAYLKYDGGPMMLGDQRRFLKRAVGIGTSQSGRFLRTFLYQGFNADEKGRRVFDGVWPHVAGAGRGSFNFRFAQPSRDAQPLGNFFYPTDLFPFTDMEQTDAETGVIGGLLAKAVEQKVVPKIFYTNGSYEYWGRAASLIHTQPPAPESRIYFFTGTQHGPGSFPPSTKESEYPSNVNHYGYLMRALLVAFNEWLTTGREPPASSYPGDDQLVRPGDLKFPAIPAIRAPARAHTAYRVDYGPEFASAGVITREPPQVGKAFEALVPAVDDDGNETSGVRMPELVWPLGTYTGWNYRPDRTGAPSEMVAFIGSFLQFARTTAERGTDPRRSIEERYSSKAEYVARVAAAARSLADRRLLLDRDVAALEARAATMWDGIVGSQPVTQSK
jgi:hypothetical protein